MSDNHRLGGQAVVNGVMIRADPAWAVAVRRADGSLASHRELTPGWVTSTRQIPVVRGVVALAATFLLGMRAASSSRRLAEPGTDEARTKDRLAAVLAVVIVVGLFAVMPTAVGSLISDRYLVAVAVEGVLRLGLLVGYIWAIGRLPGIRSVFEYHGAEHKVIAAYEAGQADSVPAIQAFSCRHARCGTDFLLLVGLVSVVVYGAVGALSFPLLVASRVVLFPLVAGVAFEGLRLAEGGSHSRPRAILFGPGLALQRLTTRSPDDEQVADKDQDPDEPFDEALDDVILGTGRR